MRAIIFFVVFLIWSQEFQAKQIDAVSSVFHSELASIKYDYQKLSLTDIWNNIKNTANRAWESIKNVANNTKKKLALWIQKVKNKVQELEIAFKERINKMKDRLNEMINEIMVTGEIVKKCLQTRKQEIDEIIKNILLDVTNCISNNIKYLRGLETQQSEPIPNRTDFLKKIQDKLNLCLQKDHMNDDAEECLHNVKNGIFEEMETTEEVILQNHIEARSSSDDLLSTIISCTTDGVIRASSAIANETIHIIECVSQGKQ